MFSAGFMIRRLSVGLCLLCGVAFHVSSTPSDEDSPVSVKLALADPMAWFDRIASASRQLNYVGIFSYQTGGRSETSRIAHRFANNEESEHLEVLDGSPREVIRQGKNVRCVLPAQRTVITGQADVRGSFPARLPQNHSDLAGNYRLRLGEVGRVAGFEVQKLILEPRDDLRFAHILWAELQSGLLLKAQVLDSSGNVIEQFAFSDVHIGGEIADDLLRPRVEIDAGWRTVDVGGDEVLNIQWGLREPLPGFAPLMNKMLHRKGGTLQMVFSDGLAAISIFIEPAEAGGEARGGFPGGGAVSVFERIADGHRITVLGEVPALLVRRAAESIGTVK